MRSTLPRPGIKFFHLFVSICFSMLVKLHAVSGQGILPLDDSTHKVTFEEIVKVDSMPLMLLQANAEAWMDRNFKSDNSITDINGFEGVNRSEGRFYVYTKVISKTIHGAIRYKVTVYTKNNKYRYVFTDFIFEYYKQDRYYNYVPTGKEKHLEDPNFPGWQKPWIRYKVETRNKIIAYVASLKTAMVYKKPAPEKKTVVKKEQW